jgi:hypothetical protein
VKFARPIAFLLACTLLGALLGGAIIATRGHSSPTRTAVAAGTYSPAVTSPAESGASASQSASLSASLSPSPSPCPTLESAETPYPSYLPVPSTSPDPSLVALLNGYYDFVDATHQTSIEANLNPTSPNYGAVNYWVVGVGYFGAKATVQHESSSIDRLRFSGEGQVYPGAQGDILLPTWWQELRLVNDGASQKATFQIDATVDRVGLTATATLTYQGQAYGLAAPHPPDPRSVIDRLIGLFNQGD